MKKIISLIVVLFICTIIVPKPTVNAQSLSDVSDHWAKEEINSLVERGIIEGFKDNSFRPNADVSRGQFAAFLVRALDLPKGSSSFVDVTKGSNLYEEISAAKKAGIVKGTLNGKALPNQKISRADAAVMLDRALQLNGDFKERATLEFTDAGSVPEYALTAFSRTVQYGFIQGTKENALDHSSTATRAESAVFIHRLFTFLVDKGLIEDQPISSPAKPGESVNLSASHVQVTLDDGNKIGVKMNTKGVPLNFFKKTAVKHIRSTDTHYYYHMGYASKPLGQLKLTLRTLDNGDTFVFSQFEHNGDNTYSASITLPITNIDSYDLKKIEKYGTIEHGHSGTFGVDPTTHPIGLLNLYSASGLESSLMLSKNYTSLRREKVYNDGQKSVLRELLEEYESYNITKSGSSVQVNLNMKVTSNAISESWALLSNHKLLEKQSSIDSWFSRSIDEYRVINKWLTAEGVYSKLPWSIEPGYQMGYGRNLGNIQGGMYLNAYKSTDERYFYDLVMNSVADLDVYSDGALTAGKVPVFKKEYTSTWLKKAYGTTAPYIDTRHNENTALFLKNTGETFNIPSLSVANLKYADFLTQQKEMGNTIPVTVSSYLIADYYAPGSKITHTSLNHALGEMRFLIETYQQTGAEVYFKTARELKAGIENLYPKWIRSNGDLWYQVNGELEFTGNDYETLTLVDLLKSQELFKKINYPRSSIFDKMIESKLKYLVKINHPLKSFEIDLINSQGFGYLLGEKYSVKSATTIPEEKDTLELLAE
ncbi:S-layer homology domain-containing protein [Bacillus seohaeanensis]|uniref:S-layer homology domain-containing protein n=1 Tax=Bacillus seohaeanensis TaxID=284580 RepID=A0ABW5RWN0_9BACI